ncbi:recombinase family protein [Streptomyces sp. bgisy084]|uniref:recombinase family protein n=1 Tax=unclassified Streptomyces TaxID=2593676 RepID=UPI003D719AAE
MIERPYDGCGKCLLGVRRLSRMKLAKSSPERQREDVLTAAASVGGHIIGWADDWEVSGATDPVTRPKLGPWLRDERGPYDGLVAAAVDRFGRNVVDCLNTGYKMRDEGGKIDHVELHPHAATVIRLVARRILADPERNTSSSEAARLNRAGELAPVDHLAVMYGKPSRGRPWHPTSLRNILLSEAALGYLMHNGRPVIDREGNPVRLCEGLWGRATHEALKKASQPGPFRGRGGAPTATPVVAVPACRTGDVLITGRAAPSEQRGWFWPFGNGTARVSAKGRTRAALWDGSAQNRWMRATGGIDDQEYLPDT